MHDEHSTTSDPAVGSTRLVMPRQLMMTLRPDWTQCDHRGAFLTMAYNPAGWCCDKCETLLGQYIPGPQHNDEDEP
jgi:hypothetical protein